MTVLGVLGVELVPDWLHPSPQIISKFGGDTASLPRDPQSWCLGTASVSALKHSDKVRMLLYPPK